MSKKKTNEIRLSAPRLVPLSTAQEREAVGLLAQLLLDIARKHPGGVSGSAFDGGLDRGIGGVVSLPAEAGKARKAA